jgi:hypothetical protein
MNIPTLSPNKEGQRWNKIDIGETSTICWLNLGNGTCYKIVTAFTNYRFFLGIERIGCFLFTTENVKYPSYIAEKLNLNEKSDACNVADWVNTQLGIKDAPEFGCYDLCYMDQEEDPLMRLLSLK